MENTQTPPRPVADPKRTVLVIVPARPTFDATAAVAFIRHFRQDLEVVVHFDDHGNTIREIELATAAGWIVLDILHYEQGVEDHVDGTRTMKAARALRFDRRLMAHESARWLALELRSNNGCGPMAHLGGHLKTGAHPLSVVGLIRDWWNCLPQCRLTREEAFAAMEHVTSVFLAETDEALVGQEEKLAEALKKFFMGGPESILRKNQWKAKPSPVSLQGYAYHMLRTGMSAADTEAQIRAWVNYFRIEERTRPNAADYPVWEKKGFRFGLDKAYFGVLVHLDDYRALKLCWKAAEEKWGRKPDLIIFRDLLTGQAGVRWSHGDLILNGGASRVRNTTQLSDDQLIGAVGYSVGNAGLQSLAMLAQRLDRMEVDTWFYDPRHGAVVREQRKSQAAARTAANRQVEPRRELTGNAPASEQDAPVRVSQEAAALLDRTLFGTPSGAPAKAEPEGEWISPREEFRRRRAEERAKAAAEKAAESEGE